jgi:hypothetical protein
MEEFLRYTDVRGQIQTTFTNFSPEQLAAAEAAGKPAPEPEPAPWQEEAKPAAFEEAKKHVEEVAKAEEVDFAALRVETRKVLSRLNKATKENTALEIIKAAGYKSLKDVPDDKLQEVMDQARERLAGMKEDEDA